MSLSTPYADDNIFAKILRGDMPCAKIFEDEAIFSFMDAFPQTRGHALVIPKAPAVNLFDVAPGDLAAVAQGAQRIGKAVCAALKPDGVFIGQFNGAAAGQTVFHLHFHVIPRYNDQPYDGGHGGAPMADMDELKALAAQIAGELD